jgi:polar amino acid transport system substrate-binding protein
VTRLFATLSTPRRLARRFACAALLVAATLPVLAFGALAQRPAVPDEWRYGRRQDPSALRYCVDPRDPDFPVAQTIGEAIAGALLLEPKPHVVENSLVIQELDDLYGYFLINCDIYLGFKLIPGAYPDWVYITRGYYTAPYLVVTKGDPTWSALADVPLSVPIGAAIGTAADLRLLGYLQSIEASRRWQRFPFASSEAALEELLAGTVGAALVWSPSLWALQQKDPVYAALRTIQPRPLPAISVSVGAAVLAEEAFVRSNVDQAIASLAADGTLKRIIERAKFPATVE